VLLEDGLRFELALIDLALPDGSGIDLIRHMATAQPDCILVVASLYADDEYLFPALRAGAQGYLLKGEAPAKTAEALQGILRGEPPLSPAIAHRLLRAFRPCPIDPVSPMTPREREILGLVAKGHSVREVATRLSLSHHTVSDHLKRIYRKLNINSRAEAALEAARMGLTAVAP
jgi:DNA-binding NarL/FixJ family response regulator